MSLRCTPTFLLYACAPLIDGLGHATRSASYLSQASCVIVSEFRAAMALDTYPSNFVHGALNGLNLIMYIGFFACFHAMSLERSRWLAASS